MVQSTLSTDIIQKHFTYQFKYFKNILIDPLKAIIAKKLMGAPNDKEIELIGKLRENLLDLNLGEDVLSDVNLVRWLRARNHNLKDAEGMFREYIKWFDETKLESIFNQELPKDVSDAFAQPVCGLDYDGGPVSLFHFGQIDGVKLIRDGYKKDISLYGIQIQERKAYLVRRMMAEQQTNNRYLQISTIADSEGLSWGQFASADLLYALVTQAKTIEAYYPETVNTVLVINGIDNAPMAFTMVWSVLKPFLSEKTMKRIQIYGNNRDEWQEAIYKLAPKESLPIKYGGILPDDVDILPKCHECVPKKRGSC